jgi:hypothetical protein
MTSRIVIVHTAGLTKSLAVGYGDSEKGAITVAAARESDWKGQVRLNLDISSKLMFSKAGKSIFLTIRNRNKFLLF